MIALILAAAASLAGATATGAIPPLTALLG